MTTEPKTENLKTTQSQTDFDRVVECLKEIKKNNVQDSISAFAGAGISVSAGIPDFRSKNGFYDTLNTDDYVLSQEDIQLVKLDPQHLLTIDLFKRNPIPYIQSRRQMILAPSKYCPTFAHFFLKLLDDKSHLRRFYSTNIDGLDLAINLKDDKLLNVHGTLGTAWCIRCKEKCDMNWFRNELSKKEFPKNCPLLCQICTKNGFKPKKNGGYDPRLQPYIKPGTVLFGENLPERFYKLLYNGDLSKIKILFVIGSSLVVSPSCTIPRYVSKDCLKVFINLNPPPYPYNDISDKTNNIFIKGTCDDTCRKLAKALGWEEEIDKLMSQYKLNMKKNKISNNENTNNENNNNENTNNNDINKN